jgi:hypothetical protein
MRQERTHSKLLGQSQRLPIGGFYQLNLGGVVMRVDFAEEPEGPGFVSLFLVFPDARKGPLSAV